MEATQVYACFCYFIHKAAEEIGMLGFLKKECGEIHFLFNTSLLRHRLDKGKQIQSYCFLPCHEHRKKQQAQVLLFIRETCPILLIFGQVNI